MKPIEKLKKQHEDIIAIIDRMEVESKSLTEPESATALLGLIGELGRLLEEHLLIEDDFLYPVLKKRENEDIQKTAHQFEAELGGIKKSFHAYSKKWESPKEIMQLHIGFVSESKNLADALRYRIEREERDLFSLMAGQ